MDKKMSQKECVDDEEDAYRPDKRREIKGVCPAHSICHRCLRGLSWVFFASSITARCLSLSQSLFEAICTPP
jgi:hypothetical protein